MHFGIGSTPKLGPSGRPRYLEIRTWESRTVLWDQDILIMARTVLWLNFCCDSPRISLCHPLRVSSISHHVRNILCGWPCEPLKSWTLGPTRSSCTTSFMFSVVANIHKPLNPHCVCPLIFLSEPNADYLVWVPIVNPQPWWRFNKKRLCLPHVHSLSVCLLLWVCVVCICFLLYLSFYLGLHPACFVLCSISITTFSPPPYFYSLNFKVYPYCCSHSLAIWLYLLSISTFTVFTHVCVHFHTSESTHLPPSSHSSQNSFWDCYGSFDDQRLFSVKIAVFRNFFDFAQIWGILESAKLWEIQCWRVADGKDESW